MRSRLLSTYFALMLVVGLSHPATRADAQESLSRPQFQTGNVYKYTVDTGFLMTMPPQKQGGEPVKRNVEVQQFAELLITGVDGTGATSINARTERLIVSIETPRATTKFDSADPATTESKMGKHFSSSLSRTVEMTVSKDGRILFAKEGGGGGALTPLPGLPQFGGPDELKQLVVGLYQGLPPEPVAAGDEWEQSDSRKLAEFGDMEFDITYHFKGIESYDDSANKAAIINYRGAMRGDVAVSSSRPGSKSSERLAFDGSNLEGRIVFDPASRTVLESKQTVGMTVGVPGPDGRTVMQLPVTQSSLVRLAGFAKAE